jgi:GPH family glycoside/pentoside/hexuronide:cation symporter
MPPNHSYALLAVLFVDGIIRDALSILGFIIASSMMADIVEDVAVNTGRYSEGLLHDQEPRSRNPRNRQFLAGARFGD